jgi:hypothetical protein
MDEVRLPRVMRKLLLRDAPAFGSRHRARDDAVQPVLCEFPDGIAVDRAKCQDPTSWRSRDCGQILGTLCRC